MKIFFRLLALSIVLFGAVGAQAQGIIFKIPDGVLPVDWKKSGFKGILMLQKDSPSGIFISAPDENETISQLRERAAKFIAPMVSDANKDGSINFEIKDVEKHEGDAGEAGKYYLYKGAKTYVQILFYERESNGSKFLYGYFGSKDIDSKKSGIWADDDGKGIKLFEKFIKSFAK